MRKPAFSRKLAMTPEAGALPLVVHLIFGDRWNEERDCGWLCSRENHPVICVKPAEFKPGRTDWRCVTGLHIALFDQVSALTEQRETFLLMLGEIAAFSADIQIFSESLGVLNGQPFTLSAFLEAHVERRKRGAWPVWWSDEIEGQNRVRRLRWLRVWEVKNKLRAEER